MIARHTAAQVGHKNHYQHSTIAIKQY